MLKAIKKLVKVLRKKALKTFTTDRGKEICMLQRSRKIKYKSIFCEMLMQHGKGGSNENSNGLLREYYPKKTD